MDLAADPQHAARALLAFWRAAGVDMDEAEAVYAAAATAPRARAPAATKGAAVKREPTPSRAKGRAAPSPVDDARALAAASSSISELRRAVESFGGCALKATARTTVFSDGVDGAPVLVIGEAPGKDEDEQGKVLFSAYGEANEPFGRIELVGGIDPDGDGNPELLTKIVRAHDWSYVVWTVREDKLVEVWRGGSGSE